MRAKRATGRWLTLALALWVLSGCDARNANVDTSAGVDSPRLPSSDVIGDLGGVPVLVPREYAPRAEYEGDPNRLEKGKEPPPVRTFESKLTRLGIIARYPDIDVNVVAGSNLGFRGDSLERPYESNVPGHEPYPIFSYELLPTVHGLTPYKAIRSIDGNLFLDDESRRHGSLNHILYFARGDNGKIEALIKCASGIASAPGATRTCEHHFVLWPEMNAQVQLSYADGLLPHWREYQASYRTLLLGFRVNPSVESGAVRIPDDHDSPSRRSRDAERN